jgi:hypothetical protein
MVKNFKKFGELKWNDPEATFPHVAPLLLPVQNEQLRMSLGVIKLGHAVSISNLTHTNTSPQTRTKCHVAPLKHTMPYA